MKKILFICFYLLCYDVLPAQERSSFEVNKKLGKGLNIGNTFEAPSETEWGNPWNVAYADIIASLGFNHVRIPIRWENRTEKKTPYTIRPDFFQRIQSVVDLFLEKGLHVVINMHHHDALFTDPTGQKERFLAQWKQIAEYFKEYPDQLLFEILNEPNGQLTSKLWNEFAANALTEIRKTNPKRTILIGTADWGGIGGLSQLQLPDDDHIIATIHYYNPFEFTHQGAEWSNMQHIKEVKWYDSKVERATIHSEFEAVKKFSETHQIPIHIGEFGAYNKADIDSRVRWTTYLARWFEEQEFSWAYWEFSAGFGIYNPSTQTVLQPLVDALLSNPIPEPAQTHYTSIYKSDFSNSTDGWALYPTAPGKATLSAKNNQLEVNIQSKGNETWHIQPTKTGIPLEKGAMYELSFTAKATTSCSFSNYVGRNSDPWNAYSGYYQTVIGLQAETYSYTFTMSEEDDPAARIAFDLGTLPLSTTLYLWDIHLQKVQLIPTSIATNKQSASTFIYYQQTTHELIIQNESNHYEVSVYTPGGVLIEKHLFTKGANRINTQNWGTGVYLVRLQGDESVETFKIMK